MVYGIIVWSIDFIHVRFNVRFIHLGMIPFILFEKGLQISYLIKLYNDDLSIPQPHMGHNIIKVFKQGNIDDWSI